MTKASPTSKQTQSRPNARQASPRMTHQPDSLPFPHSAVHTPHRPQRSSLRRRRRRWPPRGSSQHLPPVYPTSRPPRFPNLPGRVAFGSSLSPLGRAVSRSVSGTRRLLWPPPASEATAPRPRQEKTWQVVYVLDSGISLSLRCVVCALFFSCVLNTCIVHAVLLCHLFRWVLFISSSFVYDWVQKLQGLLGLERLREWPRRQMCM